MSTAEHRSLEAALTPPAAGARRGEGLAGLLGARPPATTRATKPATPVAPDEPAPDEVLDDVNPDDGTGGAKQARATVTPIGPLPSGGQAVAVTPPARTRPAAARRPARGTSREDPHKIISVAAYLPTATLAAAQKATHDADSTYAELLWEAYRSISREDLAEQFVPPVQEPDPLGIPQPPAKVQGATGVQRQFRVTVAQREWLDDQVDELGAPSRSALIATVVGMHLGTHR